MNNVIGRILALLMLVWATILSAQTVELGGVTNDGGASFDFGTDNQKAVVSFTGVTASLNKVVVKIFKTGSPTDNAVVEVRDSQDGGTLLGSASISGGSLGSVSGPSYDVTIPASVISSSRSYYVVYSRSGPVDNHNFYRVVRGSSGSVYGDVTSAGFSFFRTDTGWGSSNLQNSPMIFLWGTPVSLGQVAMSPTSLDFGNVNIGQTAQLPIRVKNTGTATLSVSGVTSNNSVFTLSPAIPPSVNVNVGDSTTVNVSFVPTATGSVSGNITITHNGVNSPTVITVTGNGVTSGGGSSGSGGSIVIGPVSFSSTSLDVGTASVGASSSRTMYLKNPDTLAVVVTNIATTTSEFVVSPTSGVILARDSMLVTLTFVPSSSGSKTATLTAVYAAGTASSVLTGSGVSGSVSPIPVLTVSSTNFSVDSTIVNQTKGVVIPVQNTGASNLFITNMYISGNSFEAFTLASPSAVTIAPGEVYSVSVLFAPRTLGGKSATLNINHNGSGGSIAVFLYGVGKDAPPQAKPVVNIKASSLTGQPPCTITFTNENTGGSVTRTEWQVKRLRDDMLGFSSSFSFVVYQGYQPVLVHEFTEIGPYEVMLTLDGPGGGEAQALKDTVWITKKDPKISVSQEVVGLPPVELGKGSSTAKFSISNVGEVGTEVVGFKISGLDSTDFRVITESNFSISPNSTRDIWVEFKPLRTIGDKQTYVYITFIGPDSPVRIKLSSTATDSPWGPASVIDFTVNNMNVMDGTAIDSATVSFTYKLEGLRYKSLVMHFGDGDSSSVINPTHKYVGAGKYSPSLVVTLSNDEVVTPRTRENYIIISSAPVPPVLPPSPDFTGDKKVDFADFFLFAEQTNKTDHSINEIKMFDLNMDGLINNEDFFIFADYFGTTVP